MQKLVLIRIALAIAMSAAVFAATSTLEASIDWQVSIDDPSGAYTALHNAIRDTTIAAGRDWTSNIIGGGTVHVRIAFQPTSALASTCPGTGTSAGCTAYFGDQVSTVNGINVMEVVPQTTIREALPFDANRVDISVFIPPASMNILWWESDPLTRAAPVPFDKFDAYTMMLHELGHGLGFFGIRDGMTGALSGNDMSTFDRWVSFDNGSFKFDGPAVMEWYGGPAPLQSPDYEHLPDGVGALRGERDYIRPLEVAFLQDMGYTTHTRDTDWNEPAVGSWSDSANWINGIPGSGTVVSIGPGGLARVIQPGAWSYELHWGDTTVDIASGGTLLNATNAYLGSSTDVAVTGAGSTWTNGRELQVGSFGIATLLIADGGNVFCGADGKFGDDESVAAIAGNTPAASGEVTVTGFGSLWDVNGELQIGGEGDGLLTIADGGEVSNRNDSAVIGTWTGSTGAVVVTGDDSLWFADSQLVVGHQGSATLSIQAAGDVFTTDHTIIGGVPGSNGATTVAGAGSGLTSGEQIIVGYSGTGTMTLADHATATGTAGLIGFTSGSTGTVRVTGSSSWINSERVAVGELGSGTLSIEDGGRVENTNATVGGGDGSLGTVFVRGENSTWDSSGNLSVGLSGSGHLQIEAGGHVSSEIGAIGHNADSTGSVWVGDEGSRWTSTELQVGSSGDGGLTIEADGTVSTMFATISTFASGSGIVTVTGDGSDMDQYRTAFRWQPRRRRPYDRSRWQRFYRDRIHRHIF